MEDKDLAEAASRGDQGAFELLFERHRTSVYRTAYQIVLNAEDAWDVAQETWIKAARSLASYRSDGSFRAWVAVIAARQALDHLRRRGRLPQSTDPVELVRLADQSAPVGNNPRDWAARRADQDRVAAAMTNLSPQQRAFLRLSLSENLSPAEIGARLGVPGQQVRNQLCRATARLREMLSHDEPNADVPSVRREQ